MPWKPCNTIIGNAATGRQYFDRKHVENALWTKIEKREHIHFSGPRRTGKTSVLKRLEKQPRKHFKAIYENIQSDNSTADFYIRMIELVATLIKRNVQLWQSMASWFESIKIREIGVKIKIDKQSIDYKSKFLDLIEKIGPDRDCYVIMLDEFPDMLLNVARTEGESSAADILNTLREVRQTDLFSDHFRLILTGSVSLLHVVRHVGEIKDINDLAEVVLHDLTRDQAVEFIDFLVKDATMQIAVEVKEHLLDRLGQFVPYYIQLIIDECDTELGRRNQEELSIEDLEMAWSALTRRNVALENWEARLDRYFGNESKFLKKVLTVCASHGQISFNEIFDIAQMPEFMIHDKWKSMIDSILVSDGYFREKDKAYYFISPFLREWWAYKFPILS